MQEQQHELCLGDAAELGSQHIKQTLLTLLHSYFGDVEQMRYLTILKSLLETQVKHLAIYSGQRIDGGIQRVKCLLTCSVSESPKRSH